MNLLFVDSFLTLKLDFPSKIRCGYIFYNYVVYAYMNDERVYEITKNFRVYGDCNSTDVFNVTACYIFEMGFCNLPPSYFLILLSYYYISSRSRLSAESSKWGFFLSFLFLYFFLASSNWDWSFNRFTAFVLANLYATSCQEMHFYSMIKKYTLIVINCDIIAPRNVFLLNDLRP